MKKGFTLIEMIGVIVIIALMALIVIPPVTRSIKKGEEDANKKTIESVIAAAKNYVSDERPTNDIICVSITSLKENGYLESDFEAPSSTQDVLLDKQGIKISRNTVNDEKSKVQYKYEYSFISNDDCFDNDNSDSGGN